MFLKTPIGMLSLWLMILLSKNVFIRIRATFWMIFRQNSGNNEFNNCGADDFKSANDAIPSDNGWHETIKKTN